MSIVKNIFRFCLRLLIGAIILFFIQSLLPIDKVDTYLVSKGINSESDTIYQELYIKTYRELQMDKAPFYFSVLPSHYYPHLEQIADKKKRNSLSEMQKQGYDLSDLDINKNNTSIEVNHLEKVKLFYPKLNWNGIDNRFHAFISRFLSGNWGKSITDGNPIMVKIFSALYWSLSILVLNLLFSLPIAFFIGRYLIIKGNVALSRANNFITMVLYSIPTFWIGTLTLLFLTNGMYGLQIFEIPLTNTVNEKSFLSVFTAGFVNYIPIVFCLTIVDIAYLLRMLIVNSDEEKKQWYISVLKARGIDNDKIFSKYILKKISIPISTLILGSLPTSLTASLFLEIIFNVRGLGRLLYDGIQSADWNLVYTIVLLIMTFTLLLFELNEWIYKKVDSSYNTSSRFK